MEVQKLFMVLLGCKPKGRFTEQHDIFFGIGTSLRELIPQMKMFWPEAQGQLHVDAWRTVSRVGNHKISVVSKNGEEVENLNLFFINLGGYKQGEFDEFHYKVLAVADVLGNATKQAKQTAFYKHCSFNGAASHVDDKYGIDVDDLYNVEEMLTPETRSQYRLQISPAEEMPEDELQLGYFKLSKL